MIILLFDESILTEITMNLLTDNFLKYFITVNIFTKMPKYHIFSVIIKQLKSKLYWETIFMKAQDIYLTESPKLQTIKLENILFVICCAFHFLLYNLHALVFFTKAFPFISPKNVTDRRFLRIIHFALCCYLSRQLH